MSENNKSAEKLNQLQRQMLMNIEKVVIPEILTNPLRLPSGNTKANKIDIIQKNGLRLLINVITDYPGWEHGYSIFSEWLKTSAKILRRLNIKKSEIDEYLGYEIKDEKANYTDDILGIKDLFLLFYLLLQNLETIRLKILGQSDIAESRGKALYHNLKNTGTVSFRSMGDLISLLKYEKKLGENNKKQSVKRNPTKSRGPKFKIEEKEGRIWIDHRAIQIYPKAKYFKALLYIKDKAPDEKNAMRALRVLEHVGSKGKRLQYLFKTKPELLKLLLRNHQKLYYWNDEYFEK
jgi:hypothetical protein